MVFRADRLRALMEQKKITTKKLADAIGVGTRTMRYYKSGQGKPVSEHLAQIAKALNTTTDYLMDLTDDPRPISESESKLLRAFRGMNAKQRNAFLLELFRKYERGES